MSKAKKQKIVYKQNAATRAKELESFLFGASEDPAQLFEHDSEDEGVTVADLVQKVGKDTDDSLLFFEDKSREGRIGFQLSDDDDDDEDGSQDGSSEQAEDEQPGPAAGGGVEPAGDEGEQEEEDADEEALQQRRQQPKAGPSGRRPVWDDPDDHSIKVNVAAAARLRKLRTHEKQTTMDGSEYEAALRKQHQILNPRTSWAKPGADRRAKRRAGVRVGSEGGSDAELDEEAQARAVGALDEEDAEALLQRAGGLLGPAGRALPAGSLETTRLRDVNQHEPSNAVIQSLRWHPNGQITLTAGLDKKLRLFQVDGLRNPKLQSCHFDDLPIHCADFASGGAQVVVSGRRPHFYVYDLGASRIERVLGPAGCPQNSLETFAVSPSSAPGQQMLAFAGDQGFIPLVSLSTRQWAGSLKMSGAVRSLAFSPDGRDLLSSGSDGTVYIWDLRTRRCRAQWVDQGNAGFGSAPSLAVSPDYKYVATGAGSGVVNVYSRSQVEDAAAATSAGAARVTPIKELGNLTTSIDTLRFSPDSQMLAFASRMSKDALRVLHMRSLSVFSNWPTSRSPLHYVHTADFSPHCGFLAIGNAKGRALLYRLHHYQQA